MRIKSIELLIRNRILISYSDRLLFLSLGLINIAFPQIYINHMARVPGLQSPSVTCTERRLRGLMLVSRDVSSILVKKGDFGWRVHSVRSLLGHDKLDTGVLDTTWRGVQFRVDCPDLGVEIVLLKI